MCKVSVIIPVYNVEEYIEECLVSVLNQTLQEIEIICVDDGTPDNSIQIIESYAKTDNRIVILHKENGGLSSARNAGLRVAQGEYVYFLDSDDYILDDTLECLYNEAASNDLDTIFFDADSFFENEALSHDYKSYQKYYHRENLYGEVVSGQQLFVNMECNNDFRPSACLQMNRRSLLQEKNIVFKEGIIHEDNLFTMRVLLYSRKAKHIAKAFYQRRVRENSIMTSKTAEKSARGYYACVYGMATEVLEAISDTDILDAYIKRLNSMYHNAINAFKNISNEELDALEIKRTSMEDIFFEIFVKNNAKWIRDIKKRGENNAKKLQWQITKLNKEMKTLKTSREYKIGRKVTFIPKKIKAAAKALKKNGIKESIKICIYKIAPGFYSKMFTKVSIIIPVYNGGKYLKQCLKSLMNQTMRDIEIICVDDSSTDNSLKLLNKYAKKDKRIRVFTQDHLGAGSARNLGIEHARGKYLLFLDCDDYFDKRLCEHAYHKAVKNEAEIVLFAAQRKDMQTGKKEKMGWVLRSAELPADTLFSGLDISERLFQVTSNCPWSKMFSKKFVTDNQLQFQQIKHANDAYFIRMGMALADKMIVLDEVLVTYRYNDGENTQSVKHLAPLEFYKAFTAVKDKLEEKGLFQSYKKSFINWTLTESLFNYNTMKTEEAKRTIKEKMINEGFDYFEITDCEKDDIYNPKLYDEYIEFIG